jgi:DNA-binding transcriptional LysR family regulator
MPELRRLRTFVVVAEELNFTRAAERLHLGQQAVSKAIQQLERELGVALLWRTTREVRLTAAGEELLRSGRGVVAAADSAFDATRRVGRGTAGVVRVGVSPALGQDERDAAVATLRDAGPELSVALWEVWPDQVLPLLRAREVELVLARTAPDAPDVRSARLGSSPARLYVPVDHRLAARTDPVDIAELDGERLLTWNEPGTPLNDLLVAQLAAGGARVVTVRARVSGMGGTLADLADLGAIAIAQQCAPLDERIVEVPLAGGVTLPLVVLWPAGVRSAAVERLRAAARRRREPLSAVERAPGRDDGDL